MNPARDGSVDGLPENARRPLGPGEDYVPLVPGDGVPEVTARSVSLGLVLCAVFAVAAAYVALKLGQGIEAAIPIAILAIGVSQLLPRPSTLLENVIVQSIGANSSHVVAGAVFTIPALYMLAADPTSGVVEPTVLQIVSVSFLGGCLGILFLIPLRRHLMVEMHGQLPWPEATATTEILLSGERAGGQARTLALAAGLGALYDGLVLTFHAMAEQVRFYTLGVGSALERNFLQLTTLNNAAVLGVGYIVGLRYSAVICAGSFVSMFLLVPLVHAVGQFVPEPIPPATLPIAQLTVDQVFRSYVRIIGVGAITGAGILGVVASVPAIARSLGVGLRRADRGDGRTDSAAPRTERSLSARTVLAGLTAVTLATLGFFLLGLGPAGALRPALAALLLVSGIAFLFAPVAARAIAIVGTNPISGMTMLTLIVTGFVLLRLGYSGARGMFVTMMVGGVVCTALAASGALASDLKVGHWLGATPARQLGLKFLGTLVAAVSCGLAMWLLAGSGGFGTAAIPAPQASAMKEILTGIFGAVHQPLQWYLFALGVIFAGVLTVVGVPALAFALGMYLPMELNTPVLLGGLLSWIVGYQGTGTSEALAQRRNEKGILVASGLIAGGALMGVFDAFLAAVVFRGDPEGKNALHWLSAAAFEGATGEALALAGLTLLCVLVVAWARR